jgi:hypothetical protein
MTALSHGLIATRFDARESPESAAFTGEAAEFRRLQRIAIEENLYGVRMFITPNHAPATTSILWAKLPPAARMPPNARFSGSCDWFKAFFPVSRSTIVCLNAREYRRVMSSSG